MLIPFLLFLILLIWGVIEAEIYAKEAVILGTVWVACLAGLLLVRNYGTYFVVPVCLVDVYLLIKMVGNPAAS